ALLRWRRPRWYPQPPPLTSRPDPIREPRRHRGGPRRPWLRRAGAVGGHRLRQRLASAGMRPAKLLRHMVPGQLLGPAVLALAQRGAATPPRRPRRPARAVDPRNERHCDLTG